MVDVAPPSRGASTVRAERRYAGASASERLAERRERLIDAAHVVFGQHGIRYSTMRMVCVEARLADRYFKESFTDCNALFDALHQRLSAQAGRHVAAAVADLVPDPDADPVLVMRTGLRALLLYIQEDPRRARVLLTDAASNGLANPSNLKAWLSRTVVVVGHRLRSRYRHLDVPLDVTLVLGGFAGLVIHTGSLWAERDFDTPIETVLDHICYAWAGLHGWLAANDGKPA